jgi:hypothetical protein
MATSFSGGGSRGTRREPPTLGNVNIKRTCVGIAVIPEGLPKKYRIIFGVTFNLFSQRFTHFDIRKKRMHCADWLKMIS